MKRKDELKLDILSNIKDEIIDAQSEKRYELMTRKRRPKWIIPSSVAAILLVAIMIPLFIVLFSKQVPVYEGMTVSSTHQFSQSTASGGATLLSASGSGRTQIDFLKDDNGNHNGHNKKPVDDIVDGEFSSSLNVPEQQMYYAKPSQDIYITVHISNPDSYEILSFTLNGKKYTSYMFEDGSDMENLILKVTVPVGAEGITEYTIDAIKYVDGTAIKDVRMYGDRTVKVGVYTPDKLPTATATHTGTGFTDFSAKISITDELELIKRSGGSVYAIICDNERAIDTQEIENYDGFEYSFNGLELDGEYRFAVVAFYDSFDGTGMNTYILYESEFKTQAILEITSLKSNVYDISGEYVFKKDDNITTSDIKVELYRGDNLIKSTNSSTFEFSDLENYTDYTVKVSVDYDLGDGEGMRSLTLERQIKTKPYIVAESCKVLNTSAIYEGDIIYLKVTIDNPNRIAVTSVTVNGIDCPIIGESTGSSLYIEVVNNGQFGAGYTDMVLETINTEEYSATVQSDLSDEIFIYGEFSVESVCFVNSRFEETEWAFPSQEIFVMVTLNNPTGYDVISINGNTDIKKIDDEHYYFNETPPSSEEWTIVGNWSHEICIENVEYRDPLDENGDPTSLELENGIGTYLMVVDSDEIKYVSSASELMNISGRYYYELTGDIDLDGVNWKPIEAFIGILNGKGYSIKNLSIIGTGPADFVGLFGHLDGGVENLHFSDASVIINRAKIIFGLVCGELSGGFVKNCTVDNTCSIIVNTDYETFDNLEYYVGGLVGHSRGKIVGCKNEGSVSGTAEHVGGIVGGLDWGSSISNCYNSGEVKGFMYVGGISGTVYGNTVRHCENRGNISGGFCVGGISGFTAESIVDCKNSGTIQGIKISFGYDTRSGTSVGGIAGSLDSTITIGQIMIIVECENNGDVKGNNQVGGIVGYTSGKTEGCINSGNISAKDKGSLGGIAGNSYYPITDCQDNGTITVIPQN